MLVHRTTALVLIVLGMSARGRTWAGSIAGASSRLSTQAYLLAVVASILILVCPRGGFHSENQAATFHVAPADSSSGRV